MALKIEDYALIGDCRTAALVGNDGSIDWLCLPHFDSAACFASLLGTAENGHWRIGPKGGATRVTRRYADETLILETEFETEHGRFRLTDFMPIETDEAEVVRIVHGLEGRVDVEMELVIRFDHGRRVPWVQRTQGELHAIAGPDLLVLRTPCEYCGKHLKTMAEFTIEAGETVPFVLTHGQSHKPPPRPTDAQEALDTTYRYWSKWAARCDYDGPWRDAVVRSLITLKALTFNPTGGIVAAPTTSLPEMPGGERNWDYRFCWVRDATFTLLTLMQAGYWEDAEAWRSWLVRAVAGLPAQLQPIYTIFGDQRLDEQVVPWLAGYKGAKPVRIGNAAFSQLQLDTYGEVLDALHHARRFDLTSCDVSWGMERAFLSHLETLLDTTDCGIWEVRGPPQHFTHSKVMMWVAFDRAVSAVEDFKLPGPVEHWRQLRDKLHDEICERAFNPKIGAFTQSYESDLLDAATLLIPLVGFLPPSDPRVKGTVEAIGQGLMEGGYVLRYDTRQTEDGLPPGEGVFLACSFWYADNLALVGRREEAVAMFERLLAVRNDVGLLPEQVEPLSGMMLGNFPQGLSHLALIDTAYNLLDKRGPAHQRKKHSPEI